MKTFLSFALLLGTRSAKTDNFTLLIDETAAPSVGAWISYVGAFLSFGEASEAQKILDALEKEDLRTHQPY